MALTKDSKTEIMNLVGYGLAKFDTQLTAHLGFKTKSDFARYIISKDLATTLRAVFNRQDSFDPYFQNGRKGWHQRNQREHIKILIDSLFGELNAEQFATLIYGLINSDEEHDVILPSKYITPIEASRFKKMQDTGIQAESYFMSNYRNILMFSQSIIEDARLWGNGFDFQLIDKSNNINLVEVKGVRSHTGSIRMTEKEYCIAEIYKEAFHLVVVANLDSIPYLCCVSNPLQSLVLSKHHVESIQTNFHTPIIEWRKSI